ncbi:hypothetical protein O9929_13265 [Vibrio lentus]|nr:hypothetical protein [Vibrio lentus]
MTQSQKSGKLAIALRWVRATTHDGGGPELRWRAVFLVLHLCEMAAVYTLSGSVGKAVQAIFDLA